MTSYAEMDRIRKQARAFYLHLRALDLEPYAVKDPEEPMGYRIYVRRLASLSERHKDRILRRVEENKAGLVRLLELISQIRNRLAAPSRLRVQHCTARREWEERIIPGKLYGRGVSKRHLRPKIR